MSHRASNPKFVWWIMWGVFQVGVVFMYLFLSSHAPPARTGSLLWLVAAIPVLLSAIIRWLILPRVPTAEAAFIVFIVGIGLAEASCFFGIFAFTAHQFELFILSCLGIAQYAPIFRAHRR